MIIYVLESKDKFHDWQPCRTLEMFVMSWREPDKKHATTSLKECRAHVRSGSMGAEFMRRCKTRYRLSTYKAKRDLERMREALRKIGDPTAKVDSLMQARMIARAALTPQPATKAEVSHER